MHKTFYIADCHFDHNNVIYFDNRPFSNIKEMNETLINNWNEVVSKNDIVYVLGDFIWSKESNWANILESLKGQIVLIRGNHDAKSISSNTKKYFADIKEYKEIVDGKNKVIMCHYLIIFYKKDYLEDYYMLFGHVHKTKENDRVEQIRELLKKDNNDFANKCHFINVGCMMPWMNYYPRTLDEIIKGFDEYMKGK